MALYPPIIRQIGQYVQNEAEDSFENQSSPFGASWKNTKNGAPMLIDSGRLKSSFSVEADDTSVTVGTNVVYAQFITLVDKLEEVKSNYTSSSIYAYG